MGKVNGRAIFMDPMMRDMRAVRPHDDVAGEAFERRRRHVFEFGGHCAAAARDFGERGVVKIIRA